MTEFIDTLRYAADSGFGIVAQKELSPYQCSLVQVFNGQTGFDEDGSSRVRLETPIYVGTPIGPNLNPHIQYLVKMDNNGVSVLSGAALSEMELWLGPIAFNYDIGVAGGLDPVVFNPPPNNEAHLSIYVLVKGPGLNQQNGNYYKITEVVLNGMDNIFYYVKLRGISDVIV